MRAKRLRLGFAISEEFCTEIFDEVAQPPDLSALYFPVYITRKPSQQLYYREILMCCLYRYTQLTKAEIAKKFRCGVIDVTRAINMINDRLNTKDVIRSCLSTKRIVDDIEFAIKIRFASLTPPQMEETPKPKPVDYGFPLKIRTVKPMILELLKSDPRPWTATEILDFFSKKYNVVAPHERRRWSLVIVPSMQANVKNGIIVKQRKKFRSKNFGTYTRFTYQIASEYQGK